MDTQTWTREFVTNFSLETRTWNTTEPPSIHLLPESLGFDLCKQEGVRGRPNCLCDAFRQGQQAICSTPNALHNKGLSKSTAPARIAWKNYSSWVS